jgi:hypothetical protein
MVNASLLSIPSRVTTNLTSKFAISNATEKWDLRGFEHDCRFKVKSIKKNGKKIE